MKAVLAVVALTGMFGLPAVAAEEFTYNMNTAHSTPVVPSDPDLFVANVVRGPKFTGEKDEKVQAIDQAKSQIDLDYCNNRGGEFVVDNGLVIFDPASGEWMVGGVCR